jgi:hypothetical protein
MVSQWKVSDPDNMLVLCSGNSVRSVRGGALFDAMGAGALRLSTLLRGEREDRSNVSRTIWWQYKEGRRTA